MRSRCASNADLRDSRLSSLHRASQSSLACAASSFAGAVGRAYALSITLAFVVKDPIVSALVALAPVRSTRAVRVFNAVASVLSLFF